MSGANENRMRAAMLQVSDDTTSPHADASCFAGLGSPCARYLAMGTEEKEPMSDWRQPKTTTEAKDGECLARAWQPFRRLAGVRRSRRHEQGSAAHL